MGLKGSLMVVALALGCADATDTGRAPWLHNTMVADNRGWLERDPKRAVEKFRKMASTPYAWFRGTVGVFLRDAMRPGPGFVPTAFGGDGPASRVLMLGDPHLENYGTFKHADGHLSVEVNDFDGAGFGPFYLDVRRLALSFWVAGTQLGVAAEARDGWVRAAVTGYVAEIADEHAGLPPVDVRAGAGVLSDDLLRRAERDGDDREALAEYTVLNASGAREMFIGVVEVSEIPGVVRDEVVGCTVAERALVRAVLAQYPSTLAAPQPPGAFTLKGVSRRLGSGVSSYPALRFYALVEGPGPEVEDDWLLEIKELPGQVMGADPPPWPVRAFSSDGERAVLAQRTWQSSAVADPLLGWAHVAPMSFRVKQRTKYQKGMKLDRIGEKLSAGDWSVEDVQDWAALAGRLVARGHARSRTLRGADGLAAVVEALSDNAEGFVRETLVFVGAAGSASYGAQTLADFETFQGLIEAQPALGYRSARAIAGVPPVLREPMK
jgi:uncharacterized protein (DUF2252 family)